VTTSERARRARDDERDERDDERARANEPRRDEGAETDL